MINTATYSTFAYDFVEMRSVAYLVLRFIHALYGVAFFAYSCWKRLTYVAPLSLTAPRRQIPKHLGVLFIPDPETHQDLTEKCLLESVYRVIDWCKEVGIATITFYDEEGILQALAPLIERHVMSITSRTLDLGLEYPPTPPLSDCASRPHSPDRESTRSPFITIQYRHTVMDSTRKLSPWSVGSPDVSTTIYLASYASSKPVIAAVASSIAKEEALRSEDQDTSFSLSVEEMKWRLEGKNGLPPSNFMIVHPLSPSKYNRTALELHGFPPFQTRLTEVYHNRLLKRHDAWINWILPSRFYARRLPVPLTELVFREALDEFAGAEMRFGK